MELIDLSQFSFPFPKVGTERVPCPSPKGCGKEATKTILIEKDQFFVQCSFCGYLEEEHREGEPFRVLRS